MNINYLSHTADIGMEIEANSLQDLFELAVKGMANIMINDFCNGGKAGNDLRIQIEVQSKDHAILLVDFLSDVLSNSYINNAIFCKSRILKLTDNSLKAELFGTHVESFDEEIKAVTYHEAFVNLDKKTNLWNSAIIFDI